MASFIDDLADAVVTRLGAATLTTAVTPVKQSLSLEHIPDIGSATVYVFPGSIERTRIGRAQWTRTYDVNVVVCAPVTIGSENTQIETYLELTEEIADDLDEQRLTSKSLICYEIVQDQPYDMDILNEHSLFCVTLTFRYKGF